jgi:hypothetical protein
LARHRGFKPATLKQRCQESLQPRGLPNVLPVVHYADGCFTSATTLIFGVTVVSSSLLKAKEILPSRTQGSMFW